MKTLRTLAVGWAILLTFVFMRPVLVAQAATPLEYDKGQNGTLGGSQSAEFSFEGKAGDKLSVIMNAIGGDIDPFVDLYDPQGKLIGEDDNGGGKDNALLKGIVLPADGVYRLVAKNNRGGAGGNYSLMVKAEQAQAAAFYYEGPQIKQNYQLSRPFDHKTITYRVENTLSSFTPQNVKTVIQQAFQSWANVTPLTFQEVTSGNSDLDIKFAPIDGALNILGETCPPSSPCHGQIQFDSEEPWTLGAPRGYQDISFLGVASHEFGHAIGLLHSSDTNALMYPSYNPRNLQPGSDDVRGAQQLYGAGTGRVSNTPAPGATGGNNQPQVRGTIKDGQYVNYWDFDVNAGETVTITMRKSSGGLDPFLVLIDANNNILAFDDDSAGGRDATLRSIRVPQSGTYTVAASRYQQAQGYTSGDYTLTIEYGTAASNPGTVATTPPNTSNGGTNGSVRVAAGQTLGQYTSLDTTVDRPFADSLQPDTQTRNATVQSNQTYEWSLTWCARDANTLNKSLPQINVTFAVNDQPVDSRSVTRTTPHSTQDGLSCVDYFVVLSGWTPGSSLSLTRTLSLKSAVFDGSNVYAQGDYIDRYSVQVQ